MLNPILNLVKPRPDLALFAHLVSRPEDKLDLAQAVLLIAECEYKTLDIAHYLHKLDELAQEAAVTIRNQHLLTRADPTAALEGLLQWMYQTAGFHGNTNNYYDPKNSFLNEVIDRKTGIPITLAIILIEIGRRVGIALRGVSFPGHFLVRMETPRGPRLIDPFQGRILSRDELRQLYKRATNQTGEPEPQHLEPAGKSSILLRVLNNLSGIYSSRADGRRLCEMLVRMDIIAPSADIRKRIGVLGGSPYWPIKNTSIN